MATEVKHAIRTAAAWTANQSAMEALYGVDGYYTTLSAWEAGEQKDLVTADEMAVAECYDDWPSGLNDKLTIDGWTTDATRYVKVTVAEGHRHNGVSKAGFWMYYSDNYGEVVEVVTGNDTLIEYVEAWQTAANGDAFYCDSSTYNFTAFACVGYGTSNGGTPYAAFRNRRSIYINCIGMGYRGFMTRANYYGYIAQNCVAVDCTDIGFYMASTGSNDINQGVSWANCVAYNCGTSFSYGASAIYTAGTFNNAASDGATVTPPGTNPLTTNVTSADFRDAANDDYRLPLDPTTSQLFEAGGDLGDGTTIYDITGVPIADSDGVEHWPIGAHRGTIAVTKTIRSSSGDYTTLSAWESGEQVDLVAADEIAVAECYDDWPSGLNDVPTIAGWTTDSERYVKVYVPSAERHNGTPATGFYVYTDQNYGYPLKVSQNYTVVEGFCGEIGATSSANSSIYVEANYVSFDAVFCRVANDSSSRINTALNFNTASTGDYFVAKNCAFINKASDSPAVYVRNFTNQDYYNCVFVSGGNTTALECLTTGPIVLKNCVAYGATVGYDTEGAIDTSNSSNNASDVASTYTPPGTNPLTTNIVSTDFADAANDDYHLAAGSSLIGAGANLYSSFTADIDGDEWPAAGAWDIGFDYYVSTTPTVDNPTVTIAGLTSATLSWDVTF